MFVFLVELSIFLTLIRRWICVSGKLWGPTLPEFGIGILNQTILENGSAKNSWKDNGGLIDRFELKQEQEEKEVISR